MSYICVINVLSCHLALHSKNISGNSVNVTGLDSHGITRDKTTSWGHLRLSHLILLISRSMRIKSALTSHFGNLREHIVIFCVKTSTYIVTLSKREQILTEWAS